MQRGIGIAMSVVGAFLLVLGIMGQTYVPAKLLKTPLNVDNVTQLSGEATSTNDEGSETYPVRAISVTHSNTDLSSDSVVSFDTSSCLFKDEGNSEEACPEAPTGRLLSVTFDAFAADRRSGMAVNTQANLPAGATPHEGLVNKWPFEAEQRTYPYWDSMSGKAVDAEFQRVEQVAGVETYVYATNVDVTGVDVGNGIIGTYRAQQEMYVEPLTGSLIQQTVNQERLDQFGNPFFSVSLKMTDEQVQTNASDAKANTGRLNLITKTVPLLGWALGLPLLLIGLFLLALSYLRGREDYAY